MGGCLMACAPQAVREAEDVVAQADSLWHAGKRYGIDEGDSATLAQAYETLEAIPLPFREGLGLGSPYAHTCYHYGKLLRAKGNPAEAMQAFISATHSGTKDYHILGRIYSNMGSICHLAGEFQLSYNMYEKSADMFIRNCDSTAYFYAINDMAFELAEQGKKTETLELLSGIEDKNTDPQILAKVYESKARLYYKIGQYDSVVQIVNQLASINHNSSTGYALQAQALWHLGKRDSALTIAKQIMNSRKASNEEKYNILYIIINGDTTLLPDKIKKLSEQRADLETKLLVPLHKQNAVAVNILHEDLSKEANLTWLYSVSITILIISCILILYIYRKRRQHALLSQQVDDLAIQNKEAEAQHEKIIGDIEKHKRTITNEIEQNCQLIINAESFPQNIYWKDFNKMCAVIDSQLYMIATKLNKKNVLNETEIRLCILVLLNLSRVDISKTLPYASSSVGKLKDQTAKKLNTTGKNLRDYLIKMAVE